MIDYKTVADAANMIINGYAFTKDSENIANKIQRKYISMDNQSFQDIQSIC